MKARDVWGGLHLPVAVPEISTPNNRTRAIGDPGLAVVASFVTSVLMAELGPAAAALWPGMPALAAEADLGAGQPPVRRIYFTQPSADRVFLPSDFPALFVFRYGVEKSKFEFFTSDTDRTDAPMIVWWAQQRSDPEREKYLDPFINAIVKAVLSAVSYGYHRSWVLPADRERQGTLATFATATTDQVVSGAGLNGGLATQHWYPARQVSIQTVVAPGAYLPGSVVQVTGIDGRNQPWSDAVTLTAADGGENLITNFRFRYVTSISVPAQTLSTGSLICGFGENPEIRSGSRFMREAGLSTFVPRHAGEIKPLSLKTGDDTVVYRLVEMIFDCAEDYDPDPLTHAASPIGMDGSYVLPNGELFAPAHDLF